MFWYLPPHRDWSTTEIEPTVQVGGKDWRRKKEIKILHIWKINLATVNVKNKLRYTIAFGENAYILDMWCFRKCIDSFRQCNEIFIYSLVSVHKWKWIFHTAGLSMKGHEKCSSYVYCVRGAIGKVCKRYGQQYQGRSVHALYSTICPKNLVMVIGTVARFRM